MVDCPSAHATNGRVAHARAQVKRVEPKTGLVLELPMAQRTTFERMQAEQPVDAADAADAQVVAGYAHVRAPRVSCGTRGL